MKFNIEQRIIYKTVHGSHAYGLNIPTSDLDIKAVCIEPKEFYFGFQNSFEQLEQMGSKNQGVDSVTYSLKKFMMLASNCNPNIIEILFVDRNDILSIDSFGERLLSHRDEFISKKAKFTFLGYSYQQLKRIKTHREWLLNPPECPPPRKDYGLSETKKMSKSDLGFYEAILEKGDQNDNVPKELVTLYLKEKAWQNAKSQWHQYENWKQTRNPARAELEAKYSYDTKHATHLIRLMRMCKEILSGQGVIVKRPDRDELLDIRGGKWSYEQLIEQSENLEKECDELYKTSALRHSSNQNLLNELCISLIEDYIQIYG